MGLPELVSFLSAELVQGPAAALYCTPFSEELRTLLSRQSEGNRNLDPWAQGVDCSGKEARWESVDNIVSDEEVTLDKSAREHSGRAKKKEKSGRKWRVWYCS